MATPKRKPRRRKRKAPRITVKDLAKELAALQAKFEALVLMLGPPPVREVDEADVEVQSPAPHLNGKRASGVPPTTRRSTLFEPGD